MGIHCLYIDHVCAVALTLS